MRRLVAAGLLIAVAMPAWAQSRPPSFPTRDATVTYTTGNGRVITISYGAVGQHMRIQGMAGAAGYVIVDRAGGTATIVEPARHMYMRMPESPAMRAGMMGSELRNATFSREGSDTVAGISCTMWKVTTTKGTGDACITSDGLLLRARGRANGSSQGQQQYMLATKVTYGALPASTFEPPAGFHPLTLPPGMMPGGAMPGGMPPPQPQH